MSGNSCTSLQAPSLPQSVQSAGARCSGPSSQFPVTPVAVEKEKLLLSQRRSFRSSAARIRLDSFRVI